MGIAIGEPMKTLALGLAFAFACAGCLSTLIPDPKPASGPPDMAGTGSGGNGTGDGTGNGNGSGNMMGGGDGGGASATDGGAPAGAKAFGDVCAVNGDCQSNLCGQFVMGTVLRCTKSCTVATQATDCPTPSDGTCNNNGYCKFDQ